MVVQYTGMTDVMASARSSVANSKGQTRSDRSGTSFDQHLKEQTKAASSRDNRTEQDARAADTGARTSSRTSNEVDQTTKAAATDQSRSAQSAKASSDKAEDVTQSASTHSEITLQIEQQADEATPDTKTEDAEAAATQQAATDIIAELPATNMPDESSEGELAGKTTNGPPATSPDMTDVAGDMAESPANTTPGQPGTGAAPDGPANGQAGSETAPLTPTAPATPDIPTADGESSAAKQAQEAATGSNAPAVTNTQTNPQTHEDATTKAAATPPVTPLDPTGATGSTGKASDADHVDEANTGSRPAPVTSQPDQTDKAATATASDTAAANKGATETVHVDDGAVVGQQTAASAPSDGQSGDGNTQVSDKTVTKETDSANQTDAPKKRDPVALTLPEQQQSAPQATGQQGDVIATKAAAEQSAPQDAKTLTTEAQVSNTRAEQVATKDKKPNAQVTTPATGTETPPEAKTVNADTSTDADAQGQQTGKEEVKAARPDQPAPKQAGKSTDGPTQQPQTASTDADPKPSARPSDSQPSANDGVNDADRSRSARSPEGSTEAPKEAGKQAPKGEAFSQLMAKLDGANGLKDQGMQTDPTLRFDTAAATQGDASTVRLTGMEHLGRPGQMPQQAAMANAQALAAQISKFANKGETRFEIRLDPADLGKVDVRLTIGSDGQARAHLFVEKSETMDFLMRDQRFLERSLQQSGINLDKQGVEYSLMNQQGRQQQMAGEQNQQQQFEQDGFAGKRQTEDESLPPPSIVEPNYSGTYMASNGVNLVI
ncbi:hook-length control protein FliK [Cohaesibacter sp. ES.047]|uniref:flagellar hook-length control protein FliK n=1 Tax=Cohaesibacter sp. ES.047 TaxID=1798205 RepID=UPI000BC05238|nr:flagellar hook-length control protein FliK [Cohaesibacter sp. ES.047]SNY91118.1 hook-length control protein FliK [Cohaesibacter sp. ES.047]